MASVGSMILGSSRSSTRTSPGAYRTAPRMRFSLLLTRSGPAAGCRRRKPANRRGGLGQSSGSMVSWKSCRRRRSPPARCQCYPRGPGPDWGGEVPRRSAVLKGGRGHVVADAQPDPDSADGIGATRGQRRGEDSDGHPTVGWVTDGRVHHAPSGPGTAPQRGRRPGRGEHRVLLQARARRPGRGLGGRAGRDRPLPPARQRRAGPPVRPGPRRRRQQRADAAPAPSGQAVDPTPEPAVDPGRGHRGARLCPQRPHGPAGRQPARPSVLRRRLRRPPASRQSRTVHLPRPARPPVLPGLGPSRDICVAILRTEAGRDPYDKELQNLVGELSTRSDEFRQRWGAHNVRHHGSGAKTYHHPIVGELTLAYEGLELAAEPGLTLTIYTAEPGTPSEEALRLLASWAASQETDPDAQTLSTERRRA